MVGGHWCDRSGRPQQVTELPPHVPPPPGHHASPRECAVASCGSMRTIDACGRQIDQCGRQIDCGSRSIDSCGRGIEGCGQTIDGCGSLRQMDSCSSLRQFDSCASLRQIDSCSSLRQTVDDCCGRQPIECPRLAGSSLRHIPEASCAPVGGSLRQLAAEPGYHGSLRQLDSPYHLTCPVHSPFRFRYANGGPDFFGHHQVKNIN